MFFAGDTFQEMYVSSGELDDLIVNQWRRNQVAAWLTDVQHELFLWSCGWVLRGDSEQIGMCEQAAWATYQLWKRVKRYEIDDAIINQVFEGELVLSFL